MSLVLRWKLTSVILEKKKKAKHSVCGLAAERASITAFGSTLTGLNVVHKQLMVAGMMEICQRPNTDTHCQEKDKLWGQKKGAETKAEYLVDTRAYI